MNKEIAPEWILQVKNQFDIDGILNGYLVNEGEIFPLTHPKIPEIIVWLESNPLTPLYTADELVSKNNREAVAQAKAYLQNTDFKMLPDYDKDASEIKTLRQTARELIRTLGEI